MKQYNLITSPVSFLSVLTLEIEAEINCHGHLLMTGYIGDDQEEHIIDMLRGDVWEKIEEVGSDGETQPLFWGIVTGWKIETVNDQKKLTLEAYSGSILMDITPHLRSFQDKEISYESIFREVTGEHLASSVAFHSACDDSTDGLVLQYYETDWDFLKRMAARHHRFLIPEFRIKGSRYYYDHPQGEAFVLADGQKYEVKKDILTYRAKQGQGCQEASEAGSLCYIIYSREQQGIGDFVMIQGHKFHIYRFHGRYMGGEMLYIYELQDSRGMSLPEIFKEELVGASLDAMVLDIKEDKVQLRIINDENKEQDINIWYPYATVYSTPDGTGWYCMPEPGDMVRLNVPGWDERQAFVTSSVHLETVDQDRKNPDHKVLKSKFQKEIRFTPDTIVITNNQGTRIELTDAEGIRLISAGSVVLESAGDMTLSSNTGSLLLAGTQTVNIRQRGTVINLSDGIDFSGGEMRVQ